MPNFMKEQALACETVVEAQCKRAKYVHVMEVVAHLSCLRG